MAIDTKNFGPPWQPIDVRYLDGPMKWTPGSAWVLDDFEKDHNFLAIQWKGSAKQDAAIEAFRLRIAETRAACPEGTKINLYATPCYWKSNWHKLTPAQQQSHVDHWCVLLDKIESDDLAVCCYDVYPDSDPTDGDDNAAIEFGFQFGRMMLGKAVANKSGRLLNLILCHRQKGNGGMGRCLARTEVEPVIAIVNQIKPSGVVSWHGDIAWTGNLCNLAVPMAPEKRAAMRADWQAETWHPDEVPDWEGSMKRVQHVAAANRRAFAGWVYHGTKETA
jgi:hypothetical protein